MTEDKVRQQVDTVGFAQYSWQMDSVMARLNRRGWEKVKGDPWKLAVCPHDDYTYVGKLYRYSTSITSDHLSVSDIGMGTTAIATDCHWVAYAALGYR
ncbi:MAG: hypothetical protein U9N72_02675 [Bacteroidota bacterium]|nr:hypothetical protein [Bacteroidota bacterium]